MNKVNTEKKTGCCLGGCLKYVLILVAVIVVCVVVASMDIDSGIKSGGTSTVVTTDTDYCAYYPMLTESEQHMYDELLKAVQNGKLSCRIDDVDYDLYVQGFGRAAIALTYDHPELFWVQGSSTCRGSNSLFGEGGYVEIELECFEYWQYTMDPDKYISALMAEVDRVAGQAAVYSTDYEKTKYVHDYLVNTAIYDYDALEESEKTIHDANCEYIYSAYGCLVNKKTVCAGYAKAFQLIMNKLDIPCTMVAGHSLSGEYHGWNRVVLDGESYYIDVTWDDHDVMDDAGRQMYPDEATYDYFGLTTEELEQDHIIEEIYFEDTPCNGTEYDYFVYNDYELSSYTLEGVKAIFDRQAAQDIVSVRFTNKAAYDQAMAKLFDENDPQITEISSLGNWQRYRWNDDQRVITIYK